MKIRQLAPLFLILAGVLAYHNSLSIPFVLDDRRLIEENTRLRSLWPPGDVLTSTSRPVVQFSLAINYALGEVNVTGYHVVNVALHILTALVLFGVLRRTLTVDGVPADSLALAAVMIWEVHPLLSQAVNYIIQRGELWMSLFYVLTLYCVIRYVETHSAKRWFVAAVMSCALGMASKPIMATAPVLVFLYDAIFLGRSIRTTLRERWGLYLGLAATWLVLPLVLANAPAEWKGSAGVNVASATPWSYLLTQFGVLVHYLRLAVWPVGLCFDYLWPITTDLRTIVPAAIFISVGLGLTAWALARKPQVGFWGLWFFLILAPTSSVIPILDVAVEHRMYLPLVAVVVLVALAAVTLLRRFAIAPSMGSWMAGVLGLILLLLTVRRNTDYQTGERLWRDTVAKSPQNVRALTNLGNAIADDAGRNEEAIQYYRAALRLEPTYVKAHYNWAHALAASGDLVGAQQHYEAAVKLDPANAANRYNLGLTLARQGQLAAALLQFEAVMKLEPTHADAQYNIGVAQEKLGHLAASIAAYQAAIQLRPQFLKAHYFLALALARSGQPSEARQHFEFAAQRSPQFAAKRDDFEAALK